MFLGLFSFPEHLHDITVDPEHNYLKYLRTGVIEWVVRVGWGKNVNNKRNGFSKRCVHLFLYILFCLGPIILQNQFPQSCCLRKCVLHMYTEVEPGLIAMHTQPEDITM